MNSINETEMEKTNILIIDDNYDLYNLINEIVFNKEYFKLTHSTSKDIDFTKYFEDSSTMILINDDNLKIELIDIINGKDSSYDMKYNQKNFDVIITKYVNIKNIKRFDESNYLSNDYKANVDLRYLVKDDLRIKKAWNLYCKIREYNMMDWWN